MAEDVAIVQAPPCRHYAGMAPSRCLIGRDAPRDCSAGCAAYAEDTAAEISLDPAERTRCEIWSRVMGYDPQGGGSPGERQEPIGDHRPVSQWNKGKQAEHADRINFREAGA